MPIENQPKVRILQQWFSEQILPWNLAKQFIRQEKSVLDLIAIGGGTETRKEIINNAKITYAKIGKYDGGDAVPKKLPDFEMKKNEQYWLYSHQEPNPPYTSRNIVIELSKNFNDIEIEINDKPPIDSLQKVLLDMLTYTYTYNRNFDGFDPSQLAQDIAKLRAKFESQKPDEMLLLIYLNNEN
ncbi:hypothetical protein [Spiroplasma ixodetis]|uniref:hypothetical protein n=1 Tax=Spiroplasma ixodetis TaxID=2141 RepID=UPI0025757641|nr:hypothetical protein [Spiroplasma ixodetis]WJG70027.1 hypothetical protein SIXOD_v1c10570 [Spiroplasma ixodetis Y32]